MLKDSLRKEIDNLNDEQLKKIADFVTVLKVQEQQETETKPFWQRATPQERSQDFRVWTARLAQSNISLTDEAFDRNNIAIEINDQIFAGYECCFTLS